MRVIGFMVCGPGEADRYLEASLKEFQRLCDDAVIVGNNTDEKTERLIEKYGYWFYRDDREWGRYQPIIKGDLLKKVANLRPDIIIPIDADEVFDSRFDRRSLEELAKTEAIAFNFYIVNLWNDERHYWKSGSFWNVRMYKFKPELGMEFAKKNVHCGLAPPYAYSFARNAPFLVKHYGLMKKEDRQKKVERYKKYDPREDKVGIGAYYEAIKSDGAGSEFIEDDVHQKVEGDVKESKQDYNKKFTMPDTKKFVYIRRLADGVVLDVPEAHWINIQNSSRKNQFEFVAAVNFDLDRRKIDVPVIEDEPVEDEPKTEVQAEVAGETTCPLCGHEAKSKSALKRHKTMKHGTA